MFDERKHPRDDRGRFTEKLKQAERIYDSSYASGVRNNRSVGERVYNPTLTMKLSEEDFENDILGVEFKGYKGQAAVDKLLVEKKGHIKNAFYREDIGNIDLLWGNEDLGLQHIIERRSSQGIPVEEFLQDISTVIQNGRFRKENDRGNFEVMLNNKIAVIAPELKGNKLTFLLTAFKTHSKK